MKLNLLKKMVLAIGAAVLFTATVAAAQTASTDEGKRKIKARVASRLSGVGAPDECRGQSKN